ncbi:SDR family oxidoreductase [Chitinophaga sancti]|uniref:NAD(P)-dependent dehydrogenase, short-chain alcohol dehydrogenase family n=1 Tax=Chitinophaga sancti TaxID=1004 RepID=A0A1K1R483_9BACT|nr:SDR family oxidoreductase [Chitinophaga sancti]WQD64253.1 SDR family oxidoreductase [Chitinophaga sancti]WQG90123.1 SDR family oxidoreductase [Chitinophaga sancti]SFW67042.1 NAD(P)-dependent dehydrogenase, short-chain alcohol dehydrogenase family [Chitinophaga sancti]
MTKIALVTGANKGIGYETAKQLAEQNIKVLLGARNETEGKKAETALRDLSLDVTYVKLDISNSADIENVKNYIENEYGALDILINNAAVFLDSAWFGNNVETVPLQTLRDTFDINYFGTVELTQALLPLIKKSESGRIVNISSVSGSFGVHLDETHWLYQLKPYAYSASKTALNQFTVFLANALKETNIKVNAANPGWVQTSIGSDQAPLTPEEGAKTGVALALLDEHGPTGTFSQSGEILPW